jgi:hypothetical protein
MEDNLIYFVLIPMLCAVHLLIVSGWFNFFFREWITNFNKSDAFILLKAGWLLSVGFMYTQSFPFLRIFIPFLQALDFFETALKTNIIALGMVLGVLLLLQFSLGLTALILLRLMNKGLNVYMEVVNGSWSIGLLWLSVYFALLFMIMPLILELLTIFLPIGRLPVYR